MGQDRDDTGIDAEGLATAVHELRTPLVTIRGFLETLRDREGDLEPALRAHVVDVALRNAVLLGERIDDLLRYQRIADDPPTLLSDPHDLHHVVERVVEDCAGILADHDVHVEVPPATWARLDGEAIGHVLANLFENAARHSPTGSVITVRADVEADEVIVEVDDAGVGITEADLPHVFEPYFRGTTRPHPGTGLGLAVVKRYVEAWGGMVRIESTPGRGTAVMFTLPAADPTEIQVPEPSMR